MSINEILQNPYFQYLAAYLRIPMYFEDWRDTHSTIEIDTLLHTLVPSLPQRDDMTSSISSTLIDRFETLQDAITCADPRLIYPQEAITWFVSLINTYPYATSMLLGMVFSAAATLPEITTTTQLAEERKEPDITWRKRVQAGDIPGAYKRGNRWLLPCSTLQVMGILGDGQRDFKSSRTRYHIIVQRSRSRSPLPWYAGREKRSTRLERRGA